jgi:2'-hydroxyisoflavone reductase
MKVLCEQEVQNRFAERALIVRPGLIVGPYDTTDRFTYWPVRMRRGGDVLVPHLKDQPVQIIDVRDLVEWCLRLLEGRASGVFNATGPWPPYQLDKVLEICAAGTPARLVWVDPKFLEEQEVRPWADLPLVVGLDGSGMGMLQIDVSKAIAAGLTFRPLLDTVRDTADWAATRGAEYQLKAGLNQEKESELLTMWRQA